MTSTFRKVLSLSAILATLAACNTYAANTSTHIAQNEGQTAVTYILENDDDGATYNTAMLDIGQSLGSVFDTIIAKNPNYASSSVQDVMSGLGVNMNDLPSGQVFTGWTPTIRPSTGMLELTNNGLIPDGTYDVWRAIQQNANQYFASVTLNFGGILDFNGNGVTDPDEILQTNGVIPNGFFAVEDVQNEFSSSVDAIQLVPEINASLLGFLSLITLYCFHRDPQTGRPA